MSRIAPRRRGRVRGIAEQTHTEAILRDALDLATDHGTREWVGGEPTIAPNAFGGHDLTAGDRTYRLVDDDGELTFHVFTGARAMLPRDTVTFATPRYRYIISELIAEDLR